MWCFRHFGLKEMYADMIHICCHCKALFWKVNWRFFGWFSQFRDVSKFTRVSVTHVWAKITPPQCASHLSSLSRCCCIRRYFIVVYTESTIIHEPLFLITVVVMFQNLVTFFRQAQKSCHVWFSSPISIDWPLIIMSRLFTAAVLYKRKMCSLHSALIVKLTFFDALDEWFCFLEHIILFDCEVCTVVGCVFFGEKFSQNMRVWCFMLDFYISEKWVRRSTL